MMLNKLIIPFFFLMAFATASLSQKKDTSIYYINHSTTGIVNRTNTTNSFILNNNLKLAVTKKYAVLNSTNNWVYGEQQSALTNNDYSSVLDFSLFKTLRNFYYWGLVNFEKSYSLKIDYRFQGGFGVGYNVVNREKLLFIVSNGILYEKSRLYDSPQNEILRNSFRIKFRWAISNLVIIDGSDFLQHSLSNEKDYILKSNTNLTFKLRKWLGLATSVTYNKLNITGSENLLWTFGLTIDKYL